MAGQVVSQRGRGSLVEQNSHSGCDQGLGGMLQYGLGLLQRHAGKPIDEVREAGTVFQVLKEGSHGDSRAPEHPGAADPLGIAFDRRTGRPVNHAPRIVPRPILRKSSKPQFRGRADTGDLPGLGPVQIDPVGGQVLQQLRSTPLVSGSNPVDALTIDIVALPFDAIFQDPDLSAALRAEKGLLLTCGLKSPMTKADMCIFERKARFYERHHQRQANRLIAVSPMIEPKARKVVEKLAIETFGDSSEVPVSGDQDNGPAV